MNAFHTNALLTGRIFNRITVMLVDESIWSRRLYVPAPIAYTDLMAHLGRELARVYGNRAQVPLPEQWLQLLKQLP